ncbi:FMN-binding protein [Ulvibacterium marinum]|uniref:FMN-binding protein n=1 Tax=Ulvibacterium marinum TaxID=2419782 RepID=UPI002493FC53|nr:FMN-binding protein [Ulvibacterium marinum]
MYKVNKPFSLLIAFWVVLLCFSFSELQISPRLQKKIDAAIYSTYGIETFQLKRIAIRSDLKDTIPLTLNGDSLFKIIQDTDLVGYLYLGEAPSMKRMFDYIVMFNPDLIIKKSKVLIYREDYGQQIGSQRWLKQFIGLSPTDVPLYAENIDAISGATISASNMTKAVANVLKSVAILEEKKLLP